MMARHYSVLALAAVLVACGSFVRMGAGEEDVAQTQRQTRVAEQVTTIDALPHSSDIDPRAPVVASAQKTAQRDYVAYPNELHGLWVGTAVECPRPDSVGDTELVMEVSPEEILGYEETFRATKVLPGSLSATEGSWRIETVIDAGPNGVFEEYGPVTFTLVNGELSVDNGWKVEKYKRCAASRRTVREYPAELRGVWMPSDMGCSNPVNHDSEDLLSINAEMIGRYENTSKPLQVEQVSRSPPVWRVLTTFSSGTGEYEGADFVTFKLTGSTLLIQTKNATSTYVKCR